MKNGKKPRGLNESFHVADPYLSREPSAAAIHTDSQPETRFERLISCLTALSYRHHDLMQGYATLVGVAGIEYIVLTSIRHLEEKGDVFLMTVADHLRLTSGAITRVTNQLADNGLVQKTEDASDRRRTKLTLTHRGLELLSTLTPARTEINDLWLDWMNSTEFMIFADVIERLIESSNKALAFQNYLIRSSDGVTVKG